MRRGIAGLLAFFCVLIVGCSDKNSVPSGILPIEKMYPMLWDMIEADQYAALLAKDSAHVDIKLEHLRLYEQVLRTYDISREKFQKSYNYYKEHPEINQLLFDSLVAQGNRLRTEVYSHPGAGSPITPPPVNPRPPAIRTPGGPNMPIIRPFIRPDTTHRRPPQPHNGV
jgi:Domain of unknown function (DUF4296)